MKFMHNVILKSLAETIHKAIKVVSPDTDLTINQVHDMIGEPPNLKMGHFAFPCFQLAKSLKKAPPAIAAELIGHFEQNPLIKEAKPVGPYLNTFIDLGIASQMVTEEILSGEFFKRQLVEKPKKVMYEYSQPNTHKELHVGHMRNLCLGNALVRMDRYIGNEVIAATYPGDVGTHVAKCLWYLKFHNKEEIPSENKGAWLGSIYTKATLKLEDEEKGPNADSNREQLATILKELESGKGEYFDLWKETREWSLELFDKTYKWADVQFDRWFFESEVDSPSLEYVKNLYNEGKLIESEGAIGMDLSDDKLGFCMLIKSDGNGLYATKDIALAFRKFEEFHLDESHYIVDKRQAFHFQQVFKVLEKLGFEHAKDCSHLQYDFVELPNGAMSSRKGNIVPLMDLVKEMEQTITEQYLEKYRGDWTDEEITTTATQIANGAIKYGMIRMDNNRKIVFDMQEWLKLDGETGPYLQYVFARVSSLCKKQGYDASVKPNWSKLGKAQEEALFLKLSYFNNVVCDLKTSTLTAYLYELGKLFNAFYLECPIGKADDEETKVARLALAKATGDVMKQGLEVLGIPAPSKM